ncbi:MAG: hypothetical protein ACOH2M_09740 [Cypionkella sp.]
MALGDVSISRADVRAALGVGLAEGMPTAAMVYAWQQSDFAAFGPVVRVMNVGSERPAKEARGVRSKFYFAVQLWVRFRLQDGSWVEEQAEAQLDQLELELITWLTENQQTALWTNIQYEARSTVGTSPLSGELWLVEDVPIVVEVYG